MLYLMLQRIFQELEHDRDDSREPPIPEDESFAKISERVRKNEDVELLFDVMKRVLRLLPIVNATISAVVFLRNGFAKIVVEVFEKFSEKIEL